MVFPYSALCSLLYPYLYFILLLWGLIVVWINWKLIIPVGIMLVVGYGQVTYVLVVWNDKNNQLQGDTNFRILSWNVGSFSNEFFPKNTNDGIKKFFFEIIQSSKADVVCLQEVWINKKDNWVEQLAQKKGYRFVQYGSYHHKAIYQGSIVLSKFPITEPQYTAPSLKNDMVITTVKIPKKEPVNIVSLHLHSNKIQRKLLDEISSADVLRKKEEVLSFADKIAASSRIRLRQVDEVNDILHTFKNPTVICVDLNEVAGSYTYNALREKKQDAFLEYGSWFRFTFLERQLSVGIDYIFADEKIHIKSYHQIKKTFSDHLPHYVDF